MKKLVLTIMAALAVFCTSCLNMGEEITLNEDGSGSYVLFLDLDKAIDMMMSMAPDSVKETMTKEQMVDSLMAGMGSKMGEDLELMDEKMGNVEGVSNLGTETEGAIMRFKFDFENIDALNNGIQAMGFTEKQGLKPSYFAYKKGLLDRQFVDGLGDGGMDEEGEGMEDMMKMMFKDATYTVIYNLPGKVKKAKMNGAEVSGNTVTQTLGFLEIMEDTDVMTGKIKFK